MPVLMQARVKGMTEGEYRGLTSGDFYDLGRAEGYLGLHVAGPSNGGWQVFETWESVDAHQSWVESSIAPLLPAGAADAMEVTYHELVSGRWPLKRDS